MVKQSFTVKDKCLPNIKKRNDSSYKLKTTISSNVYTIYKQSTVPLI